MAFVPCGHGGLFLFVVWAASGGGKAGPVMGLRPLLGPPCIPPEAPRLGFPVSDIPRGLRGFCSGSFLAALGDLPARRAMPAGGIALDERAESVGLAVWSPRNDGYCLGKVRWGSHSCGFIENKAGLVL